MDLVISRKQWLRGEGPNDSFLLRKLDGKMCCLGFLGLACGLTQDDLLEEYGPADVPTPHWPAWLYNPSTRNDTNDCVDLMRLNDLRRTDDLTLTETSREQRIADIFARHGVTVTFVD